MTTSTVGWASCNRYGQRVEARGVNGGADVTTDGTGSVSDDSDDDVDGDSVSRRASGFDRSP